MRRTGSIRGNLGSDIEKAAAIVRNGGVIVFPTDTVYGLGADPRQPESIRRLIAIKGRADGKGLPVLLPRKEDADGLVKPTALMSDLASAFWPGALTIVMRAREPVDSLLLGPGHTLGIRVPGLMATRRLIELAGSYLIGTSANLSGSSPAVTAEQAFDVLGESVDYIFDGGPIDGAASTVLDIDADPPEIVRSGAISAEQLRRVAPTIVTRSGS